MAKGSEGGEGDYFKYFRQRGANMVNQFESVQYEDPTIIGSFHLHTYRSIYLILLM